MLVWQYFFWKKESPFFICCQNYPPSQEMKSHTSEIKNWDPPFSFSKSFITSRHRRGMVMRLEKWIKPQNVTSSIIFNIQSYAKRLIDSVFKQHSIRYTNQWINYSSNKKSSWSHLYKPLHFISLVLSVNHSLNSHPFYSKYEDKTVGSATWCSIINIPLYCVRIYKFSGKLGIV